MTHETWRSGKQIHTQAVPSRETSLPHMIERLLSSVEAADAGDPREWWESIRAQVRAIREEME